MKMLGKIAITAVCKYQINSHLDVEARFRFPQENVTLVNIASLTLQSRACDSLSRFVGWSVRWLVGWSVGQLVRWLVADCS